MFLDRNGNTHDWSRWRRRRKVRFASSLCEYGPWELETEIWVSFVFLKVFLLLLRLTINQHSQIHACIFSENCAWLSSSVYFPATELVCRCPQGGRNIHTHYRYTDLQVWNVRKPAYMQVRTFHTWICANAHSTPANLRKLVCTDWMCICAYHFNLAGPFLLLQYCRNLACMYAHSYALNHCLPFCITQLALWCD